MLAEILQWVLGATSVIGLWLAGKHDWRGWAFMFATEPIWGVYSVITHAWGILFATFAYAAAALWNLVKWRREQSG